MKNILIATPSYDGKLDVWYVNSLLQTLQNSKEKEIKFSPVFMSYDALVQRSRNDLLALAKHNNFEGILWIDSDMAWEPEWAFELIQSGKDIIGLPCIRKSLNEQYNVKCDPKNLIKDEDGLIKVEAVGTGFLYMSKKAIDHLWDQSEPYMQGDKEHRWVFEVGVQDKEVIGEDTVMCFKAKDLGVYINPAHTCSHVGVLKYDGDFDGFIEKVKLLKD